jgi:osmotically-inducible protein OsmY
MVVSPVRAEQNTPIHMAVSSELKNTEHNTSHFMSPPTMLIAQSKLDNTEQNARDKDSTTLTPKDQKETKTDIKITSNIRKTVVRDKSLSIDAQNAKIITRNGMVTLRGPVANEAEKMKLQQITQQTKGVVQVDNQLENKAP